jgi:outer membrane biosynthesis protein TonB
MVEERNRSMHISRRAKRGCTVVLSLVCLVWLNGVALADSAASRGASERPGVCERQAVQLVGQRAVRVGKGIKAPRKVRDVRPDYPSWPPETTGRGVWMGEALIDTQGRVSHVWTIREAEITPELPAFNRAIVDAIRQWQFEPLVVNGVTVPVCMTVVVNPNWQ